MIILTYLAGLPLPFSSLVFTVQDAYEEWYNGFQGGPSVVTLSAEAPWLKKAWKGTKDEMACPWSATQKSRRGAIIRTVDEYSKTYPFAFVVRKLEEYRLGRKINLQSLGKCLAEQQCKVDYIFQELNS